MAKSLDIILNAINNTGPGTQAAAANIREYSREVLNLNSDVLIAKQATSLFDSLTSSILPAVGAAGLLAGAGVLIYQNWDSIRPLFIAVSDTIQSMLGGTFDWGQIFQTAAETVVTGLAGIEVGFQNMEMVGLLALSKLQLEFEKFSSKLHLTSTEVIPKWFKAWKDGEKGYDEAMQTVTHTVASDLPNWLLQGLTGGHGEAFKLAMLPSNDTLAAATPVLDKIAPERIKSDYEKGLEDIVKTLTDDLKRQTDETVAKRVGEFRSRFGTDGFGIFREAGKFFGDAGRWVGRAFDGGLGGIFGGGLSKTRSIAEQAGGESSRFLTGASAATAESLMREQLELEKKQAGLAQQNKDTNKSIETILKGDFMGLLRQMTAKGAKGLVLG
jgi:hypothetical protein